MHKNIKFIDLFAGVGGFHFAFKNKAECVFASEWDKKARETYLNNFGEEIEANNIPFVGDIASIDPDSIPEHDILCAGFPCQPFSLAGKKEGFLHPTQGTLFFNIVEIIKAKRPRVVFLENVKNLRSHDKGRTYQVILDTLTEEGYYVRDSILNGSTHGNTPQNRERIFIVAFKNEEDFEKFVFPEPIELTKRVVDCLEEGEIPAKYYQTNMESPSVIKMHEGMTKKWIIYQYRRFYMRENMSGVCPTLTANMGTGGHNVPLIMDNQGIRKLTPRECFNFQGFPDDFIIDGVSDSHLYKQAGNSVVLPVVSRIADRIISSIA
jgi:DNA (cytosine-5)-methyltransferase 1